ncbi:MAG: hypothetical protein SOZ59_02040 [Candidatus Limivivens sp.]|nr:hypothetical protein [Candidatus Limivivens sp.]
MLFQKKKKTPSLPSVCIRSENAILYEGLLKEIPLKESVMIEKSIYFFNDPEPCYIHRGAVRVRLTEELHQELLNLPDQIPGPLLLAYADLEGIKTCRFLP